jgi:hypothetical protein
MKALSQFFCACQMDEKARVRELCAHLVMVARATDKQNLLLNAARTLRLRKMLEDFPRAGAARVEHMKSRPMRLQVRELP